MRQAEFLERWKKQCDEYDAIASEMVAAGLSPSAYQVSLKQRERALARGEKLLTHADLESIG